MNPVLSARCEWPTAGTEEVAQYSCEHGSIKYFALCALGGMISCGTTHTGLVPLDIVTCRLSAPKVGPAKYKAVIYGFKILVAEGGVRSLGRGWAPTFIGYSLQGACKFGFYEVFKVYYAKLIGEENAYTYRTSLYLAASASAEFIADIALCPMESVKIRIQAKPGWSTTLREGFPRIMRDEGMSGFYKGLVPLWRRQIPYTMMTFACFERTLEALYRYVVPKPRSQCSKSEQLAVAFAAGYIAGVLASNLNIIVSILNQAKGSNFIDIAKRMGLLGMWKGRSPSKFVIGTLTAAQWFIYDGVKVAFSMPRPPPPEMPESMRKRLGITQDSGH